MARMDIVGLSLAEIALVLLFSLLAALAPLISKLAKQAEEKRHRAEEVSTLRDEQQAMKRLIEGLKADNKAKQEENDALKAAMEGMRAKLQSIQAPSCVERNLAVGWLFTATIRGRDSYEINRHAMSLRDIARGYDRQIRFAKEHHCVQRINLYYGNGVTGADYDYSLRRIQEYFYVKFLGAR